MSRLQEIIKVDMSSYSRNGQIGHRNYKYRRLSSAENGSIQSYATFHDDDDEIFTGEEVELQKKSIYHGKEGGGSASKLLGEYECLVDRPVLKGDSLRSLALHYGIPVSELKRVNKIVQESEFYALQSIKIPVKPHQTILAEMLEKEHLEYAEEEVAAARENVLGTRSLSSCSENESESEMHVGYISIDRILKDTRFKKEAKKFFANMHHDLALIREKNKTYKDNLDEAAAALTDIRFYPLEKKNNCSGADWGLKWWVILAIGAVLLVGIPIYCTVYLMEMDNSTDGQRNSSAGGQESVSSQ